MSVHVFATLQPRPEHGEAVETAPLAFTLSI